MGCSPSPMTAGSRSAPKGKVAYAIIAMLLVLAFVEAVAQVARIIHPDWFAIDQVIARGQINKTMVEDERLLWRMPPGDFSEQGVACRINGLGMRGALPPLVKETGELRILYLGDSSVYGFGVEETKAFPYLTAALMAEKLERSVVVINAAAPGYSSTQCRILFEDIVEKIQPDLVVFAALWSDMTPANWTDADLLRRFSSTGYRFNSAARLQMRRSGLFSLLEARLASARSIPENRTIFWQNVLNTGGETDRMRVSIRQHAKNMRAVCRRCRQDGIEIALLILPYNSYLTHMQEISSGGDDSSLAEQVLGTDDPNLKALRKNYRRAAAEFSAGFLDMQELLESYRPEEIKKLFLDTIHPNVMGHALIAEQLSGLLLNDMQFPRKVGTLPPPP
jgi:lysophospholipase L1-like esterase